MQVLKISWKGIQVYKKEVVTSVANIELWSDHFNVSKDISLQCNSFHVGYLSMQQQSNTF